MEEQDDKQGWIRLSRRITEMDGYFGEPFCRAMCWIDLLLIAEWKPRSFRIRGNLVKIERGQLAISVADLAKRWGFGSRNTVYDRLKEMEADGRIRIERSKVVNKITILNYQKYQNIAEQQTEQHNALIFNGIKSPTTANSEQQTEQPLTIETNITNNRVVESACAREENQRFKAKFFGSGNTLNLEAFMMQLHLAPDQISVLKDLADQVICQWELSETDHRGNYREWSQHLMNTMRIKYNAIQKNQAKAPKDDSKAPTAEDYKFDGGF